MPSDWIIEDNLKPLLETLATFAGYSLDAWDWDAVQLGIKGTDVERGDWYEYELSGNRPVRIRIAKDVGSSVIFIDVNVDGELDAKVAAAMEIMQTYHLTE